MLDLQSKANTLRQSLPKNGKGVPPSMKGIPLGVLPHKEGEIRLVWDEYEGFHFLSVRLWTKSDDGSFWPSKNGFTVKLKDLPVFGEAVGRALDMAIADSGGMHETRREDHYAGSREGVDVPF